MAATKLSTYSRKVLFDFELLFNDDPIDDRTYCNSSEELSIACYWRGRTLHVLSLEDGRPLVSWTFRRRLETPCVLRCVEPMALGSQTHVACSLTLLEESASIIFLVDVGTGTLSRVIRVPHEVTALTLVVGPRERLDAPVIGYFSGVLAVGCRGGFNFLIDLALDHKIACGEEEMANIVPIRIQDDASVTRARKNAIMKRMLLAVCLDDAVVSWGKFRYKRTNGDLWASLDSTDVYVSCLTFLKRLGLLAVGFNFGGVQLWNMRRVLAEYSMAYDRQRGPVVAINYQEPEDDPKSFVYLWLGRQGADDVSPCLVSLLQLGFARCHRAAELPKPRRPGREHVVTVHPAYECLMSAALRFQQALRVGTSPSALLKNACIPLPRTSSGSSLNTPDSSLCLMAFIWREERRTLLSLFDLDRWYHAQMPSGVPATGQRRPGVPQAVWDLCPFFCTYDLAGERDLTSSPVLDGLMLRRSVSRWRHYLGVEQSFYPAALSFDVFTFSDRSIVRHEVLGIQELLLLRLARWSDSLGTDEHESVSAECRDLLSRCLVSGLLAREDLPAGSSGPSAFPVRALLEVLLELGLSGALTALLSHSLPGGRLASRGFTLPDLVQWSWSAVEAAKRRLDRLTTPLFDLSGARLDAGQEGQLQAVVRRLAGVERLLHRAAGGGIGEGVHARWAAVRLLLVYAQAVHWSVGKGLLPESAEVRRGAFCLARVGRASEKRLKEGRKRPLVDGLVELCGGGQLRKMWLEHAGEGAGSDPGTVFYPPPSMQAMLSLFLLPAVDEEVGTVMYKHWLMVYFLLDAVDCREDTDDEPHLPTASELWEDYGAAFGLALAPLQLVRLLWSIDQRRWPDVALLLHRPGLVRRAVFPRQHTAVLTKLVGEQQPELARRYYEAFVADTGVTPVDVEEALLFLNVQLAPDDAHTRLPATVAFVRRFASHMPAAATAAWRRICERCLSGGSMTALFQTDLRPQEERQVEAFLKERREEELLTLFHLQRGDYMAAKRMRHGLFSEERRTQDALTELYLQSLPRLHRRLLEQPNAAWLHPPPGPTPKEVEPQLMPLSLLMARQKDKIGLSSSTALLRSVSTQLDTMRALNQEQYEAETGHDTSQLAWQRHPSTLLFSAKEAAQTLGTEHKRKLHESCPVEAPTPVKRRLKEMASPSRFTSPMAILKTPGRSPHPAVPLPFSRQLPDFAQEVLRTPPVSRRKIREKATTPRPPSILKTDSSGSHRSLRRRVALPGEGQTRVDVDDDVIINRSQLLDASRKLDFDTSFTLPAPSADREPAPAVEEEEEQVSESCTTPEPQEEEEGKDLEEIGELLAKEEEEEEESQINATFTFAEPSQRRTNASFHPTTTSPAAHFSFSPPAPSSRPILKRRPAAPPAAPDVAAQDVAAQDFSFSPPRNRQAGGHHTAASDTRPPLRDFLFSPPIIAGARRSATKPTEKPQPAAGDAFLFSPPRIAAQPAERQEGERRAFIFSPPATRSGLRRGLTAEQRRLWENTEEQRQKQENILRRLEEGLQREENETKKEEERKRIEEEEKERRRKEEEQKRKEVEEKEKKRKEEEEKKQKEEEEKRQKEAEKNLREEQKRKEEEEKKRKEDERKRREREEEEERIQKEREEKEENRRKEKEEERKMKDIERKKKEKEDEEKRKKETEVARTRTRRQEEEMKRLKEHEEKRKKEEEEEEKRRKRLQEERNRREQERSRRQQHAEEEEARKKEEEEEKRRKRLQEERNRRVERSRRQQHAEEEARKREEEEARKKEEEEEKRRKQLQEERNRREQERSRRQQHAEEEARKKEEEEEKRRTRTRRQEEEARRKKEERRRKEEEEEETPPRRVLRSRVAATPRKG